MTRFLSSGTRPAFAAAAALLFALGAAGCTVGPDYVRPPLAAAPAYVRQQQLQPRDGQPPAPPLDAWWRGFDDPELARLETRALASNLDLAAAWARVDAARATAREAGAARLPALAADGEALEQTQSTHSPLGLAGSELPGYRRSQSYENLDVGASWELDLAGGLRRTEQAARAEAGVADAQRLGVRVSLAAEVADAYFRVRGAQARIALTEQQIATDRGLLDLVRYRLADGLATRRESDEANALLLEAQATLPPLRVELATQLNRLDVLMGAPPGTYASEIEHAPQDYRVPAIATDATPADLLRRRPDVIAAERRLAAASARIGVATAEYYPKLSLAGLLGVEAVQPGGALFDAAAFQPQAVLGLHWRLFEFGRIDAEVARAKGADAEALAQYRQAMLKATEDVENALVSLEQLQAQHDTLSAEVAAHDAARAAAEEAYKGGAVGLLDVLDEDRELLAARDELARVHADDARAAVAAFRALGGGWHADAGAGADAGADADADADAGADDAQPQQVSALAPGS